MEAWGNEEGEVEVCRHGVMRRERWRYAGMRCTQMSIPFRLRNLPVLVTST